MSYAGQAPRVLRVPAKRDIAEPRIPVVVSPDGQ